MVKEHVGEDDAQGIVLQGQGASFDEPEFHVKFSFGPGREKGQGGRQRE